MSVKYSPRITVMVTGSNVYKVLCTGNVQQMVANLLGKLIIRVIAMPSVGTRLPHTRLETLRGLYYISLLPLASSIGPDIE